MENKLVTLTEILERYETENIEDILDIRTYAPIALKKQIINFSIQALIKDNGNSMITYDSIDKEVFLIITALQIYTNIDFNQNKGVEIYDVLMERQIVQKIILTIGPDFADYEDMYNAKWKDFMRDNNSIEAIIAKELNNFNLIIQSGMVDLIKGLDLKDIDLSKLLNQITETADDD